MLLCVSCKGVRFSPVKIRAGQLSFRPEAPEANQEETNGLKHFGKRSSLEDQRSVRAVTRVNIEQASKSSMWKPTRHNNEEGRRRGRSEREAQSAVPPG